MAMRGLGTPSVMLAQTEPDWQLDGAGFIAPAGTMGTPSSSPALIFIHSFMHTLTRVFRNYMESKQNAQHL